MTTGPNFEERVLEARDSRGSEFEDGQRGAAARLDDEKRRRAMERVEKHDMLVRAVGYRSENVVVLWL